MTQGPGGVDGGAHAALPSALVIDCEAVTHFDTTGAAAMTSTLRYGQRYGVELVLARLHLGARRLLEPTGDMDEIGEHRVFDTVRHAVNASTAKGYPSKLHFGGCVSAARRRELQLHDTSGLTTRSATPSTPDQTLPREQRVCYRSIARRG